MKKIILMLMIIFIAGCSNKSLQNSYDKMQVGDSISGYNIDLRIYGKYEGNAISKRIIIVNHNNDCKITEDKKEIFSTQKIEKETIYVKNSKVYTIDNNDDYILSSGKISYANVGLYIQVLENIISEKKPIEEEIGSDNFLVYKLVIRKDYAVKLLNEIGMPNIEFNKDFSAECYVDEKGYISRIIYYLDDITINANYYNIDNTEPIIFPNEVK